MRIKGLLLASLRSLALCGVCVGFAGCEGDRESTVVNEAPGITVPTNGTTTVTSVDVNGNSNQTIVYVESSPGVVQVVEVDINGNSNVVGIIYQQPQVPVPMETEP
jgi:hypothetical protein